MALGAPLTAGSRVVDRSTASSSTTPVALGSPTQSPAQQDGKSSDIPVQRTHTKLRPPGKVPLEKGYSQMEWMRLTKTHSDLAGLDGKPLRRGISMKEVRQHKSRDDCWLVYAGKVYNATPYIKFHPGGADYIMLGAGKDATALFNKYHRWVNMEMMMSACLVGLLGRDQQTPSES